jgi:hypothetical protein
VSENSSNKAALEKDLKLLKAEEARFRYLVTSNKASSEYRKEALAKLEDARRRIYQLSCKIAALDSTAE